MAIACGSICADLKPSGATRTEPFRGQARAVVVGRSGSLQQSVGDRRPRLARPLHELRQLTRPRYLACERNCFFQIFSSSAATAGGGLPFKVDLPF